MTKRLLQLCRLIPPNGNGFADVGTDHGFVPVWLANHGYSGRIYSFDIAEAPLNKAISLASEHMVDDRICFSVSDGLDACPPGLVDCIMIAGLGGDAICRILDRAEWILDRGYTLILQPMTHAEVVRYWLIHNGFRITTEALVSEDRHIYQIFTARAGNCGAVSDAEYCTGIIHADHIGEDISILYSDLMHRIEQKLVGMRRADQMDSSTFRFYAGIMQELEKLSAGSFTTAAEQD